MERELILILLPQKMFMCSNSDFTWSKNILTQHEISGFPFPSSFCAALVYINLLFGIIFKRYMY